MTTRRFEILVNETDCYGLDARSKRQGNVIIQRHCVANPTMAGTARQIPVGIDHLRPFARWLLAVADYLDQP